MTIYVGDMDRAVGFYTGTLGLTLRYRFGDHWASVEVGRGLTIGLHPAGGAKPAAGAHGPEIGLELEGPIEAAVAVLEGRGVHFEGGVAEGKSGKFAHFADPDGNRLYLAELNWSHVNQGEGNYQHE